MCEVEDTKFLERLKTFDQIRGATDQGYCNVKLQLRRLFPTACALRYGNLRPRGTPEPLKHGWSKWRRAVSVKYTLNFEYAGKK